MDAFQINDEESALKGLQAFYEALDRAVADLVANYSGSLCCSIGCTDCCIDGITVFAVEAENIRRRYRRPPIGAENDRRAGCVFLDAAGSCRIYPHRPYVCRTQGLPLRWIEDQADGSTVEMRDICHRNDTGPPLELRPESAFWTIGPFEAKLAQLQKAFGNRKMTRIALRDLFAHL